jgi:hypothetical protein
MGSNVGINIKRIEWGLWTDLIWLVSVTRGWRLARVNTVLIEPSGYTIREDCID